MIQPEVNFSLTTCNTLGVESEASFFYACSSIEKLEQAIFWAKDNKQAIAVLGGGSKSLLDRKIKALVLQPAIRGIRLKKQDEEHVWLSVGAGEEWHAFTQYCVQNNFYGLENLSLIPGSVGAAPIQNIGAYGVEVASFIEEVDVYDIKEGCLKTLTNQECKFAYRDSIFKHGRDKVFIVCQVHFRLLKQADSNITYPALKHYFQNKNVSSPSPLEIADAVIEIRSEKLPSISATPNAGSFFKNPVVSLASLEKLKEMWVDIPNYDAGPNQSKLAAAWLIDQAGWKGKNFNGVSVHDKQALVLINPERRPLADILKFSELIIEDVFNKFGVKLELEPQKLHLVQP